MADHSKPTTASTYAGYTSELDARFDDLTLGLDPAFVTATNIPLNALRFSSAAAKWQRWDGSSWVDPVATYAISIAGNAATVTNGVYSNGSYANPSWITSLAGSKISGDITGNAGSATVLATARTINGVSFNGSANISVNTANNLTFSNAGGGAASGVTFNGGSPITISYNSVGAPSTSGTNASGTWNISITGNAATATSALSAAAVTNGVYTTGDQTIGGSKTFVGNTAVNGTLTVGSGAIASYIYMADTDEGQRILHCNSNRIGFLTQGGDWGSYCDDSGNWLTNGAMTAAGNVTAGGSLVASSDERLKRNWRTLPENFLERLARVKMGIYDRIDNGETQAGVSAQAMQALLPHVVREGIGGFLAVNYGNAALVAAIALAEQFVVMRRELDELKGA